MPRGESFVPGHFLFSPPYLPRNRSVAWKLEAGFTGESGGIGRRARLRIWWGNTRGGSSPPFRTSLWQQRSDRKDRSALFFGRADSISKPLDPALFTATELYG